MYGGDCYGNQEYGGFRRGDFVTRVRKALGAIVLATRNFAARLVTEGAVSVLGGIRERAVAGVKLEAARLEAPLRRLTLATRRIGGVLLSRVRGRAVAASGGERRDLTAGENPVAAVTHSRKGVAETKGGKIIL